ncbi:MAG: histidine phosphatase family protein [Maritimibacter sp.]
MTLTLILTRHAKSAWGDPVMDDHDRPLTTRGHRSAEAVGTWLAERDLMPGEVFVSSANRTRQTWGDIAKAFDTPPQPLIASQLYHSEPETMLGMVKKASAPVVMLIAHNPGMAYFAYALAETQPRDHRFARYPTGATTVLEFDAESWSKIGWHKGTIRDLVFPRDLI